MKTMHIIILVGTMVCSPVILADPSFDVGQLGHMKGIVDVCSKVNPRQASNYFLQMKELIGDATKQSVDQAARTEEYQQAYQAVTTQLRDMSQEEMTQACTGYLTTSD